MEFDTRMPIYVQIIEKIKKDIILGRIKRGEKMPSVRIMATELKVNVNTVQRVYQEMEREEIIYTQRGKGSFITENEESLYKIRHEMAEELLRNFVGGMKELGYDTQKTLQCLNEYVKEEKDGDREN